MKNWESKSTLDTSMVWDYSQSDRPMEIATPFGKDHLLLESFELVEGMSRCFQLNCNLLSVNAQFPIERLLRRPVRVGLRLNDGGGYRYIHGYVREAEQVTGWCDLAAYRIVAVPQFWFLHLAEDCRIFQHLSVPEIVEQMLNKHSLKERRFELQRDYPKREYCVQYRESDFQFVCRLLEEEGIHYSFRHDEKRHSLILADYSPLAPWCPGAEALRFDPVESNVSREDAAFDSERRVGVCSDRVSLKAFNFESPRDPLLVSVSRSRPYESYDYPGKYEFSDEGDREARLRLEERETPLDQLEAVSWSRQLAPGFRTTLQGHTNPEFNRDSFVVEVRHAARDNQFRSNSGGTHEPFSYSNQFRSIPAKVPYRPTRAMPKPFIRGSQTAIVTGPKDEEIYTDKYGRVKVQFHWDRLGKFDENTSCWIRVSHAWAGDRWGAIFLPRIGQEVIVSFLEGDPDQPIITGRVYNGDMMPPYELPANKALAGVKSDTYKGRGYNEIVFDDTAGRELIRIHGMKDRQTRVNNDDTASIGRNRTESVGNDEVVAIANNQVETVGNCKHTTVANNYRVDCDTFELHAKTSILLHTGASTIHMNQAGVITIKGNIITVLASVVATVTAPLTSITGAIALALNGAFCAVTSNVTNIFANAVARIKAGKIKLNC